MIELVFIITLCGVLFLALPKQLDFSRKSCYLKLAHTLNTIQEQLSFLYTRYTLDSTRFDPTLARAIIEQHTLESQSCSLKLVRNRLRAEVFGSVVYFTLEPNDFSEQPSFKCPFSRNSTCREILLRSKKM